MLSLGCEPGVQPAERTGQCDAVGGTDFGEGGGSIGGAGKGDVEGPTDGGIDWVVRVVGFVKRGRLRSGLEDGKNGICGGEVGEREGREGAQRSRDRGQDHPKSCRRVL